VKNNSGFTLVEVLIGIVILSIVVASMIAFTGSNWVSTKRSFELVTVSQASASTLEDYKRKLRSLTAFTDFVDTLVADADTSITETLAKDTIKNVEINREVTYTLHNSGGVKIEILSTWLDNKGRTHSMDLATVVPLPQ